VQTNEFENKDLLHSTPSSGTALDLPQATTFSNTHSNPMMKKSAKDVKLLEGLLITNNFQNMVLLRQVRT